MKSAFPILALCGSVSLLSAQTSTAPPQQRAAPPPRQVPADPAQTQAAQPQRVAPAPSAVPTRAVALAYPGHQQFSREVRSLGYHPVIVTRVPRGSGSPPVAMQVREQHSIAGPAPGPGFVFIPGYYAWSGSGYVWYRPVWAMPPVSGAV
jgi:hypothetical protein